MSASHLKPPGDSQHKVINTTSLDLTIRFSASLPDLPLSISDKNATTSTVKQLIRKTLPVDLQNRRIRLIHSGKALSDEALLSTIIKRPVSQPPSRVATPGPYQDGGTKADNLLSRSKGKEPVRDPPILQPRTYIHCSIGDVVLSPAELAAEAALANQSSRQEAKKSAEQDVSQDELNNETINTTPTPRGFDRLLTAGFTAAEVQSLRLQFMDIQAHIHTPDTMPSPNTLRDMEDRWLDNGNGEGQGGAGGAGFAMDDAQAGALDDMLWGAVMGFVWPVGCLFWGAREEGIWSQRRKMAVVIGVALNVGIALVRYTS